MGKADAAIDLFAEDRAHELFVSALIRRILAERGVGARVKTRVARGGHGKALEELRAYQMAVLKRLVGLAPPDLLVVVIDANCRGWPRARDEISREIRAEVAAERVVACPDPHVERWFFADPEAFSKVVGVDRQPGRRKCERDYYKKLLREAVAEAGHPPGLSGLEFADELAREMDLYRAGRNEPSLGHLVDAIHGFAARSLR